MFTLALYIAEIVLHTYLIGLLAKRWKSNKALFFLALFNLSIITWIGSVWLIGEYHNDPQVIWFVRASFVSTSVSVASFVVFLRYHINKRIDLITTLIVIFGLFSILQSATPYLVEGVTTTETSTFVPVIFNKYAILYIIYVLIGILTLSITVIKNKKSVSGLESLRISYITTGTIIGGAIALFTNVILPIMSGESNTAIWGPVAVSTISIFSTYSFAENRLFSISFIASKIIYLLTIILLPLAFLYTVITLQVYIWGTNYSKDSYIFALICSGLFIFLFTNLNQFITKKIFPTIAFNKFNPEEVREKFSRDISTKLDINLLGAETIATVSKIFSINKSGLIIFDKENSKIIYKISRNINYERFPFRDLLQVIQYWNEVGHSTVLVREEISGSRKTNARLERISRFMEGNNIEVIMPLNRKVQLNGVILMGEKDNKSPFTIEDIRFLETLIINASVAFGRALLYQEVEDFNKTLQQKVNEQTQELQTKIKELEEARRKEADMIDIMGHELRTPATIVKLNVDLLHNFIDKIPEEKESFTKYVTRIKDAVENEIKLINTLLSSAKLEGDKIEINPEKVDIYNEVDMALHGEEKNAKEKTLNLINNINKNIPNVYADHARTVEILNNLISNAVKYTDKGSVTIDAQDLGNVISISVTDTGRGLSSEDIPRLGTKFFRTKTYIESEDSDDFDIVRPGGTGLGLYVTFNLVRRMGGTVHVESELGKGSTFSFTLPKYVGQEEMKVNSESVDMFAKLGLKK